MSTSETLSDLPVSVMNSYVTKLLSKLKHLSILYIITINVFYLVVLYALEH